MGDEVENEVLLASESEKENVSSETPTTLEAGDLVVAENTAIELPPSAQSTEVEVDDSPGMEALGTAADHMAINAYVRAFHNAGSNNAGLPPLTPLQKNLMASIMLRVPPTNITAEQMDKVYAHLVAVRKWHQSHKILFGKVVTMKTRSSKTRNKKKR